MAPSTSALRLVQFLDEDDARRVAKVDEGGKQLQVLADTTRIYDLALEAGRTGVTLDVIVASRLRDDWVDYDSIIAAQRLLPPLDHPDPAKAPSRKQALACGDGNMSGPFHLCH